MNRNDKSKYLLYIEPDIKDKLETPIEDNITSLVEMALSKAEKGTARYSNLSDNGTFRGGCGYKGSHRTDCGVRSTNVDYLLENGMITNSLAPFYVKWYRYSIPENDMNKIRELAEFYNYDL